MMQRRGKGHRRYITGRSMLAESREEHGSITDLGDVASLVGRVSDDELANVTRGRSLYEE